MPKRLDGQDTVDVAVHLLHRLQAEGMAVQDCQWSVEYGTVGKTRLPVSARVVVDLVPLRG